MTHHRDKNGNFHDENGRFVSLRDFVERIFAEREASAEFKRVSLERALDEAKSTTATALTEARVNVAQQLLDAKVAADQREAEIRGRLDKLESGGAPFANRLDEGVKSLRTEVDVLNVSTVRVNGVDHQRLLHDVEVLNTDAVRTKVLDALRVQQLEEAKQQRKQSRAAFYAAATALAVVAVQFIVSLAR